MHHYGMSCASRSSCNVSIFTAHDYPWCVRMPHARLSKDPSKNVAMDKEQGNRQTCPQIQTYIKSNKMKLRMMYHLQNDFFCVSSGRGP